jgi:hypothetical protein
MSIPKPQDAGTLLQFVYAIKRAGQKEAERYKKTKFEKGS